MSEEKNELEQAHEISAEKEQEGLPAEEFGKLLESIGTMAPLMRGILGNTPSASPLSQRREQLLLALKPYLSSSRCEAIDYLIRIGRIGDAIRALQ